MTEVASATSKAAAAYQLFQTTPADQIATLADAFQELVSCVANSEVQMHVRVYAFNIIRDYGALFETAKVKVAMQAIVQLLGEEDEAKAPTKLLTGAVAAFVGVCKNATTKQEDLVRVAADLCIQIILGKEGFPEAVGVAAAEGLQALIDACFLGVVKKLLHLLSDDREKDETEQLEAERAFSLSKLKYLVTSPKYAAQWSEEVQNQVATALSFVLNTITAAELKTLASFLVKLPKFDGSALLEILIKTPKIENGRLFESISVLSPFVAKSFSTDVVAEKLLSVAGTAEKGKRAKKGADEKVDLAQDICAAHAAVLAARTCGDELSAKLIDVLLDAVDRLLPAAAAPTTDAADDNAAAPAEGALPDNLSILEAILLALAHAGTKHHDAVLARVSDGPLAAKLESAYKAVIYAKKLILFGTKKMLVNDKSLEEARPAKEALTCLTNVAALLGPLTTKHLPSVNVVPSWQKLIFVPVAGKKRQSAAPAAPLSAEAAMPSAKKNRAENGNKHNNNNNNNKNNNNGNAKNQQRGGAKRR